MDYYECEHCGNVWPDYEPKVCPFCFDDRIKAIGVGIPEPEPQIQVESDTVSKWTQTHTENYMKSV